MLLCLTTVLWTGRWSKMIVFLLYFGKWWYFSCFEKNFINELENLLIFKFCINKVKMMFCFHVIKYIITIDISFTQNGVKSHFMMIKFSSINNKVLQNNCRWLEIDSKSFGSKVGWDWFTYLFFGSFSSWWRGFPHINFKIVL